MDRFRTLPSVIFNNDRTPLKRAEEMAIVIGLAATRLRQTLDTQEATLFTNVRRMGLAIAASVLGIAVLAVWWLLTNGQSGVVPYVIIGAVLILALIGVGLGFAPYTKRFRVSGEQAAVTRIARLYWPIGILPLGSDRALLWDALSEKNTAIDIVDLPPTVGLEQETAVHNARKAESALHALITYESDLQRIAPETTAWPATPPDASLQQVGAEAGDLWKRMTVLMADDPASVLGFHSASGAEAWRTVADEGERVHTFFQEIESMRLLTERYRQRAQSMVDRARELAVEHGFGVMQAVDDERVTYFKPATAEGTTTPTIMPGEPVAVSIAASAEQIRENLLALRNALKPLDENIGSELNHLSHAEAADIRTVENGHIAEREQIHQIERSIEQRDSEVLKLADSLEIYRQRMVESRDRILSGYESIAETPMEELRNEVRTLESAVASATTVLDGATPKMDLPGLDRTLKELTKALKTAHQTWQRLATDLPARGKEVQSRLESIQQTLTGISEGHLALAPSDVTEMLGSVKSVERVARDMVSWTTSQQDPLSPIEDHDHDLNKQIAALNDVRRRLEQAHRTLAAATSSNGTGTESHTALPVVMTRVDRSLSEYIRLGNETSSAAAALNNAAETVQKQSSLMAHMLEERNALRATFEQQSAALTETIQQERDTIRGAYAQRRAAIAQQRADLDLVPGLVMERLERTFGDPALVDAGTLSGSRSVPWSELVVNQIGLAIDEWGKRVAGIDGISEAPPLVQQVRDKLEAGFQSIIDQSVPARLNREEHPLSPHICFVPFWYVETQQRPHSEAASGRMVHLFPPLHLDRPSPTDMPAIEGLRYREVSRRLLAYLRRDFLNGGDPADALSFDPLVLTDLAKTIPEEAGAPPWQELATALAQHWVFFRSDDSLLNRIVLNSRDHLLPADQIVEAWIGNAQQPALSDKEQ